MPKRVCRRWRNIEAWYLHRSAFSLTYGIQYVQSPSPFITNIAVPKGY